MKKYIPLLLIWAAFGCTKTADTEDTDTGIDTSKKYTVNLNITENVESFTPIQYVPVTKSVMATGNFFSPYVNYIYYRIYKADGTLLRTTTQYPAATNYGKLSEELSGGNYQVFVAASKNEVLFIGNKTLSTDSYGYPNGWTETFTSLSSLTVDRSNINHAIKLERAGGALDLTITDAIPANVYKITVSLQPENSYKAVNGAPQTIPVGYSRSTFIGTSDVGVKNKNFFYFVSNTGANIKITVSAYNASNTLIAEKVLNNVVFTKNKKSSLAVALFTP